MAQQWDDLHPYDGLERRFRSDDADPVQRARGIELVRRMLGLPAPPATGDLRYDLSFYSGGMGIIDKHRIAMPCSEADARNVAERAGFLDPEAMREDPEQRAELDNFLWHEDEPHASMPAMVSEFIEKHRRWFQPVPNEHAFVWFSPRSGVNHWELMYAIDGQLGFIAFDQG